MNNTQSNIHTHIGFYYEYANRKATKKKNIVRKTITYLVNKLPFTIEIKVTRKQPITKDNDSDSHLFI